ncbi:MAG: heavy-metal-associated domain-containing protein [Aggregatilineales bacterium]
METKTFQVPNIGCDGCVRTITNEVKSLKGVKQVQGDADTKTVTVNWESPATWDEIRAKLTEIDYAPAQS